MPDPTSTSAASVDLLYTLAKMYADDDQVAAGMVREAIAGAASPERSDLISALFVVARRGAQPGREGMLQAHLREASATSAIDRFVDTQLPYSFAALRPQDRMLIALVDGLDEDSTRVLAATGLDAHGLSSMLFTIRRRLLQDLNAAVPLAIKRQLPPDGIGDDHLRPAVHRLVHRSREATPVDLVPRAKDDAVDVDLPEAEPEPMPRPYGRPTRTAGGVARRVYAALIAIVVAGGVGYLLDKAMNRPPMTDMIDLVITDSADLEPSLLMDDIRSAERFLSGHSHRLVRLPSIAGAALTGVSIRTIAGGVTLPAAFYRDRESGTTVAIYVSSYSDLSMHHTSIRLDRSVLMQIEDELTFDLHNRGHRQVLVWRDRSTIFLAVAEEGVASLFSRIAPAAL